MSPRNRAGMEWPAIVGLLLLGVGLASAPTWVDLASRHDTPVPAVTVTTVPTLGTLPACDDDTPGRPVTGPCWLMDDRTLAVWPYPYAPTPVAVLGGWTP